MGDTMETEFTPIASLVGGLLIGIAAVLMMVGSGRIAGVSGIIAELLRSPESENAWRATFIAGLLGGAVIAVVTGVLDPGTVRFPATGLLAAIAGLLVGAGTSVSGGCTSGHGICGVARLSPRSLVATCTFMAVAFVVVFFTRHVL
jgi:uncharacterized membrane protein YedE/YeeE